MKARDLDILVEKVVMQVMESSAYGEPHRPSVDELLSTRFEQYEILLWDVANEMSKEDYSSAFGGNKITDPKAENEFHKLAEKIGRYLFDVPGNRQWASQYKNSTVKIRSDFNSFTAPTRSSNSLEARAISIVYHGAVLGNDAIITAGAIGASQNAVGMSVSIRKKGSAVNLWKIIRKGQSIKQVLPELKDALGNYTMDPDTAADRSASKNRR